MATSSYINSRNHHGSTDCDDMRGNDSISAGERGVHTSGDCDNPVNQIYDDGEFARFVAIRLEDSPQDAIACKSLKSFRDSLEAGGSGHLDQRLKTWVASMIERKLTESTRKRYFRKLSAIFKEYSGGLVDPPFSKVFPLCACTTQSANDYRTLADTLTKAMPAIAREAAVNPAAALMLYLLFNGSADVAGAVGLTTENYMPEFPQLDGIIDPSAFHHRRRYVFGLSQSRRRMPQIVGELSAAIDTLLRSKGIDIQPKFTFSAIPSLWIAKARSIGTCIADIRAAVDPLPEDFSYFSHIDPSSLTPHGVLALRRRVAKAFMPVSVRWYAMRLRKGMGLEDMTGVLKEELPGVAGHMECYYPQCDTMHREGKKMVRRQTPFIPGVVFFSVMPHYVADIDKAVRRRGAGWVFRTVNTPDSDYSVIDKDSMFMFQKAVGQFTADMRLGLTDRPPLGVGKRVRITGGMLAGLTGTIYAESAATPSAAADRSTPAPVPPHRIFSIRLSESMFANWTAEIEDYYIEEID